MAVNTRRPRATPTGRVRFLALSPAKLALAGSVVCFVVGFAFLWNWPRLSNDERRVRDYIVKNSAGPVTFVKWGPHAKAGECYPLPPVHGSIDDLRYRAEHGVPMPKGATKPLPYPMMRVVVAVPNGSADLLIPITPKGIGPPGVNFFGDGWIEFGKLAAAKHH